MSFKVALPSSAPGGLAAELSDHFGHCEVFTLVTLDNGEIRDVETVPNMGHEQGGCMGPVNLLASNGANVMVAGGMGMRPLMGFHQVGIEVFHHGGIRRVDEAVQALAQGRLARFGQQNTCGGHDGGHEGGCGSH